jgi:hypothetical protein
MYVERNNVQYMLLIIVILLIQCTSSIAFSANVSIVPDVPFNETLIGSKDSRLYFLDVPKGKNIRIKYMYLQGPTASVVCVFQIVMNLELTQTIPLDNVSSRV